MKQLITVLKINFNDCSSFIAAGIKFLVIFFKAIGGVWGQKTCQAYFEELIAVVSTFFTECQNLTRSRTYDLFNFRGLDFYVLGNRGVIFVDFFTNFAYKIVNIDVESTKIVTKMQTMNRITKKS